jgi:transposase
MPALPPYTIEPVWQQLSALLPERETSHPLGCHRPRTPDRVVFEKLVQVLVFGCAYEKIADESAPAGARARRADLQEGQTRTLERDQTLGRRTHQLLAERPQEAPLVHGAARQGGGLLGGPLGRDRHRQAARPGGVDPLPLGRAAFSETLTYWRSL